MTARDRFDVAAAHCADLGITIEWADLGPTLRGLCAVRSDVILLNRRLTLAQAAATLAHEIGHWTFGDLESTPARERRAWQYGAALLIDPSEYARAERLVGPRPAALALELGVTPRLIESWQAWWRRSGGVAPAGDSRAG